MNSSRNLESSSVCSADVPVCCIAGFSTCGVLNDREQNSFARSAGLETGDTAGLETCATQRQCAYGFTVWLVAFALACLFPAAHVRAAEGPGEFLGRTYTNQAGATLPYRLLLPPKYDAKRSYPVLLYLHGAAARGDDNLKPLDWGPRLIAEALKGGKHECFLVVPQCSRSETWSGIRAGGTPDILKSLQYSLELVTNALPKEFNLDPARRYLTGVSMGGHATWALACQRPELFAAVVPVCGGGDATRVNDRVARVPLWAFHSDDDHLVPVQHTRAFVKAWRDHGGKPHYTEYTGLKHSSWQKAYTEAGLYEWLLAQRSR